MSDALSVTGLVFYQQLNGNIGTPVFQHVPQDFDPAQAVTVIGEMSAQPLGTKDDPDRRISVTVYTIRQGEQNSPVMVLQQAVVDRLDGKSFMQSGFVITPYEISRTVRLMEDGTTYVGTTTFTVMALKA